MGCLVLAAILAVGGAGHGIVEGQVVKVDLSKGLLVVKVEGPRELVVVVDESSTRLSRQGRSAGLNDVRSGEKVTVSCEPGDSGERGRCHARFIKVGVWKLPGQERRKESE